MKRKDKALQVTARHYDNCIAVNLERGDQQVTVRLYPQNDSETQKSADDFASILAHIIEADWLSIDRRGLSRNRPFMEVPK